MHHAIRGVLFALALTSCGAVTARADAPEPGGLSHAVLPCGLEAAGAAIGARGPLDAASFLPAVIERFYNTPREIGRNEDPRLRALLTRLAECAARPNAAPTLVPLPVTAEWWTRVVFKNRVPAGAVVPALLSSRDTALLYRALLALDPPTRAWIAGRPALVSHVLEGRAALLLVGAPGVRIVDGALVFPGGEGARVAWEALVGVPSSDPEAFVSKLLDADDGRAAYALGRLARMPDTPRSAALHLRAASADARIEALRRVYRAVGRTDDRWRVSVRPFWRPPLDAALFLSELPVLDGAVAVPGGPAFWTRVFAARGRPADIGGADVDADGRVDLAWLVQQIFDAGSVESRLRMEQVMLASRVFPRLAGAQGRDAAVALAALGEYPALVRALERLQAGEPGMYVRALERARQVTSAAGGNGATSLAQLQASLALLSRAVVRQRLDHAEAMRLAGELFAIEVNEAGDYDGALARWVDARLRHLAGNAGDADAFDDEAAVDEDLVRTLAGRDTPAAARIVEWEGASYRVDLPFAEARRLERVRGDRPPLDLRVAWTLFRAADRVAAGGRAGEVGMARAAFDQASRILDEEAEEAPRHDLGALRRDVTQALAAAARGDRARRGALATRLRRLADRLTATGLAELAYAAALGGADGRALVSAEAASRHDFGLERVDEEIAPVAWRLPTLSARARGPWHIEGALLGLDLCLAETWLPRVSNRPLAEPPSVDKVDRRTFAEAVTLMDGAALDDRAMASIAQALRKGRAIVASAGSPAGVAALTATLPIDESRRAMLSWSAGRSEAAAPGTPATARSAAFAWLSTTDLVRLGARHHQTGDLDRWGAPARPRLGCPCLQFPWLGHEDYMGHLSSGILASGVADLPLRVAELLDDAGMPAALAPHVLAPATLDLVNRAVSEYPDDLRGIRAHVHALSRDDLDTWLALLTTDGPLVPLRSRDAPLSGNER